MSVLAGIDHMQVSSTVVSVHFDLVTAAELQDPHCLPRLALSVLLNVYLELFWECCAQHILKEEQQEAQGAFDFLALSSAVVAKLPGLQGTPEPTWLIRAASAGLKYACYFTGRCCETGALLASQGVGTCTNIQVSEWCSCWVHFIHGNHVCSAAIRVCKLRNDVCEADTACVLPYQQCSAG